MNTYMYLTGAGTSAASLSDTCTQLVGEEPLDFGIGEFSDISGTVAFTLSWITNIWATSLIAYRAW